MPFASVGRHGEDHQQFGFLNRWNDTLATPLEDEPIHFAEDHLAKHGWTIGKHAH